MTCYARHLPLSLISATLLSACVHIVDEGDGQRATAELAVETCGGPSRVEAVDSDGFTCK